MSAVESAVNRFSYHNEARTKLVEEGFDEEMHVHFRRRLARLLFTMQEKGIEIGPIGIEWLENAKTDRFVDVRQAATNGSRRFIV